MAMYFWYHVKSDLSRHVYYRQIFGSIILLTLFWVTFIELILRSYVLMDALYDPCSLQIL